MAIVFPFPTPSPAAGNDEHRGHEVVARIQEESGPESGKGWGLWGKGRGIGANGSQGEAWGRWGLGWWVGPKGQL